MPDAALLSPEVADRVRALAVAAAPREFVAVLGGRDDGRTFHVDDLTPLAGACCDDDAFTASPVAFVRAEGELRAAGHAFVGFVHSHPGGSAALSLRDRQQLWPTCLQLVVGGRDCETLAAFQLDHNGEPRPLALRIARPRPHREAST